MSSYPKEYRRLDLLLQRLGYDGQLAALANWARQPGGGIGVFIELLVDGVSVRGNLTPPESFARDADAKIAEGLMAAPMPGVDDVAEAGRIREGIVDAVRENALLTKTAAAGTERLRTAHQRIEAHIKTLPPDSPTGVDDAPDDLWSEVLITDTPPLILTLENAAVLRPGAGWTEVGYMRVHMDHVGAWWVPQN